jgi:ATP/maltotriose-dependent transcriptional regulator MalT
MNLIFVFLILAIGSSTPSFAEVNANTETAIAFRSRDISGSERLAHRALERFGQSVSKTDAGIAAANLGAIEAIRGSLKEARKWHETAESLFREAGEDRYIGRLKLSAALVRVI